MKKFTFPISFSLFTVPPEWIVEPKNVEITAGEQISVPCSAFGVPEPRIIWERAGKFRIYFFLPKFKFNS